MRPHSVLSSLSVVLSLLAPAVRAQGVVNESLLRAPEGAAVATWSSETFERVQASVVHVEVEVDGPRGAFAIERASSGVIVDAAGLVVTWYDLVAESVGATDKKLLVQLNDAGNTRLDASLVAHDEASGLALLRVTPPADGLQAAKLGADHPAAGDPVLVVARPTGEDMLAFSGVASPALTGVTLGGRALAADEVFLTDSRNDERCDGAPIFRAGGDLLGLYDAEHVQRDVSEPKLEDLQKPSYGVAVPAARIRSAFAAHFGDSANETLRAAPSVEPHAFVRAVERVAPSVVGVWSGEGDWPQPGADDPGCVQRRKGLGSGVVVSASGLVIANLHVAHGGEPRVRTRDGAVYPAELVKRNVASNLALLQVELPAGTTLTPAVCGHDDDVQLGEAMLAVGNPLGRAVVVSKGVISAMREREGGRIQADANLGNQNGGGAVVDAAGRLIGVGDAGIVDPLEMAWAQRGERVTQETNLSTFVGIGRVRRVFASAFAEGAAVDSIQTPQAVEASERAARRSVLAEMVEKASGAMLNIYVARNVAEVDEDDPFASMAEPQMMTLSLGSGVIIDRSGLAVSNWHVVDAATNPDGSMKPDFAVTARVFGGKQYDVKVLSISREDDLSLLQLQLEPGEEVHAVEIGNSERLGIGEAVAAIGNPHGRANTITYGVVSAKGQGIKVRGRWAKLQHLIETDAAINGGNSGGALLDMSGRLVGINSAGGGTFNNKGYAIAVDHVRRQILGLLFQPYKLRSPELGMRVLDGEQPGDVVVMDVDERGPAAAAGVRSGDRIRSLAGVAIDWSPGFALTLLRQQAGAPVELVVERGGQQESLQVAPLSPDVWSVIRQSGLRVRDVGYAEEPDRMREAAIALHRAFTGDPTGAPQRIPERMVAVERVFEQPGREADVRAGDLLLAVELIGGDRRPRLLPIDSVVGLSELFSDRVLGKTPDVDHYKVPAEYAVWIDRGGEVQKVTVAARRLLW